MNRDELLTKLAMELAEWPLDSGQARRSMPDVEWAQIGVSFLAEPDDGRQSITEKHWRNERERLINKPSWDDAPDWAQWLCQQKTGCWLWYASEPALELNKWKGAGMRSSCGSTGDIPAGHDWRTTLEHRPASEVHTEPEWDGETWPPPINKMCEYFYAESREWRQGVCVGHYNGDAVVVDCKDDGASVQTIEHVRTLRTDEQREEDEFIETLSGILSDEFNVDAESCWGVAVRLYQDGYRKEGVSDA